MGPLLTEGYAKYMVQRCAARWVKADNRYNSSVSTMLSDLQWPSLQYYEIKVILHHSSPGISSQNFQTPPATTILFIPFTRSNNFNNYSYYPKSICDWNNLPTETIESQSLELFLDKL